MIQKNKAIILFLGIAFVLLSSHPFLWAQQKDPQTVAESSDFTATSRYADVMKFIEELQQKSSLLRVETLCVSTEGRKIPLLVIGKPVPSSPLALQHHPRIWGKLEDMETKKVQGYGKEELYREAKESGLVADNKELTDEGIAHQKNLRAGHVSLGEKGTEFFYSGPSLY